MIPRIPLTLLLLLYPTGIVLADGFKAGDSCSKDDPGAATPWDKWIQAPAGDPRTKTKNTQDWLFQTTPKDIQVRLTPKNPGTDGNVFLAEGPYCRTTATDWTGFKLKIQYKAIPGRVTPKGDAGKKTDQDFGNSGVYIFDRWEIQVIDPTQFDDDNNKPGVAQDKPIKEDSRITVKKIHPLTKSRSTPAPSWYRGVPTVSPSSGMTWP